MTIKQKKSLEEYKKITSRLSLNKNENGRYCFFVRMPGGFVYYGEYKDLLALCKNYNDSPFCLIKVEEVDD